MCTEYRASAKGQVWSVRAYFYFTVSLYHETGLEISKRIGTQPAEISLVSLVLKTNCFLASMLIFPFHSHVTGHKTGLEISKKIGTHPAEISFASLVLKTTGYFLVAMFLDK